jgi:RNA polymerase sigma factor (sigma-70 family)
MANDDMELVRQYAVSQSESAFAALVSRYTNLVYSAAFRRVGNSQLAEEITQAVFIILAQKAGTLKEKTILPGWLYRAACYVSGQAVKQELRRQRREQEAYMESLSNQAEPEVWPQITPLLEDAMMRLGQAERDALVLRFFEGHSLKEVGNALGTSEAATKMRVGRALEKLRTYFSRHGVNSTAETIAGAISANSVMVAPATLTKVSIAVALAKGSMASTSATTLVKGAMKMMIWRKMKIAIGFGAAIILVAGATTLMAGHEPSANHGPDYRQLDDAFQLIQSVDQSKFVVRIFITSRNRAVRPADIRLTIQSAVEGPLPVQLGTNGQLLDVPHDSILRRENPPLVFNQPKGSLNLSFNYYLPVPRGLVFHYNWLGDGIAEVNKAIATANGMIKASYAGQIPLFKLNVQGVFFVFPRASAGKAMIDIYEQSGRKEYTAGRNGVILLKLDPALLEENPEISISEKPRYVVPNIQR